MDEDHHGFNRIAICVKSYQSAAYSSLVPARQINHTHESATDGTIIDRNVRNIATYFQITYIHPGELIRLHDRVLPVSRSLFLLFPAKIVVHLNVQDAVDHESLRDLALG